jgi:hypothetical protein
VEEEEAEAMMKRLRWITMKRTTLMTKRETLPTNQDLTCSILIPTILMNCWIATTRVSSNVESKKKAKISLKTLENVNQPRTTMVVMSNGM